MSLNNKNDELIYDILMTKINEYIDTIVLNKDLEAALKKNVDSAELIQTKSLLEVFKRKKDEFSEKNITQEYISKNPESLTRKLKSNLTEIFSEDPSVRLKSGRSPVYQKMTNQKNKLDPLIRDKFYKERIISFLNILKIEFTMSDFKDESAFVNKIRSDVFNDTSGSRTPEENYNYMKDKSRLSLFLEGLLRPITSTQNEAGIISKELQKKVKDIIEICEEDTKFLKEKINIFEFILFMTLTNAEIGIDDSTVINIDASFNFDDVSLFDNNNKISLQKFLIESNKSGKEFSKYLKSEKKNFSDQEYSRYLKLFVTGKVKKFIEEKNNKQIDFRNVKRSNRDLYEIINEIKSKNPAITERVAEAQALQIQEEEATQHKATNKDHLRHNFNAILKLIKKDNKKVNYFEGINDVLIKINADVSEVNDEINKILDFEIKKDAAKDFVLENILSGKITEDSLRANVIKSIGDSAKDKIALYIIQEMLQSITKRPKTTPQLLESFKTNHPIINNFILNSQNLSISRPQKDAFKSEDVGVKILYASSDRTESIDQTFSSNATSLCIMKENIQNKKYAPRSGSLFLGSNPNYLTQRYGISKVNVSSNAAEVYSLNELLFIQNNAQQTNTNTDNLGKTDFCYIMINNPLLRISSRNELELSVFMNLLSTVELSKCSPYLDMRLELPSILNTNNQTLSINTVPSFLYGTPNDDKKSDVFNNLMPTNAGKRVSSTETNMSLFSMPQTLNNFDESNFSRERKSVNASFSRFNNVYDTTRPFLTLKSFTIDVAPTQGLMSFKTGKVSLVLHDKSRMNDVAPFIKPDLFGVHGSEIVVTYGWNNIENNFNKNLLGAFLNNQKVTEKYIITNSSFNITKNGEVNIDLSVAMRGPIDLKSISIEKDAAVKINIKPLEQTYLAIKELHKLIENAQLVNDVPQTDFNIQIDFFDSIYNFCKSLTPSNYKEKNTIIRDEKKKQTNITVDNYKSVLDPDDTGASEYFDSRTGIIKNSINNAQKDYNDIKYIIENFRDVINTVSSGSHLSVKLRGTIQFEYGNSNLQNITISTLKSRFKQLLNLYKSFFKAAKNYIGSIESYNAQSNKYVNTIIAGLDVIDPFYDRKLNEEINSIKKINRKSLKKTPKSSKAIGNKGINVKEAKLPNAKFVTLGTFITGIIGTQLANLTVYDDIQIISYCANSSAGLMSGKNISSLLIPRDSIEEILKNYFSDPEGTLTLEGFFSQVIELVNTNSNASYGLSSLYESNKEGVVSPYFNSVKTQETAIDNLLKIIYTQIIGNKTTDDATFPFKRPKIRMSFDTMIGGDNNEKTILRISIYDDNDNPFEAISELFIKDKSNDLLKAGALLGRYKATEKQVVYDKKSKEIIDKLKMPKSQGGLGLININSKGEVTFTEEGRKLIPIKNEIKRHIPSVTYGTQNSGIVEASVTTVNEAKLNTVYLTRDGQQSNNLKKLQSIAKMPLSILPAQASVTTFGCPFVNFAQFMFLDFETGTTLDNIYAVTGIKHDFSPGRFMTTLTMSYGDIYGKYRNAIDLIEKAATSANAQAPTTQTASASASTPAATAQSTGSKADQINNVILKHSDSTQSSDVKVLSIENRIKLLLSRAATLHDGSSLESKLNTRLKDIQFYIYHYPPKDNLNERSCTYTEVFEGVKHVGILFIGNDAGFKKITLNKSDLFNDRTPATIKKSIYTVTTDTDVTLGHINSTLAALDIYTPALLEKHSPKVTTTETFTLTMLNGKYTLAHNSVAYGNAGNIKEVVNKIYDDIIAALKTEHDKAKKRKGFVANRKINDKTYSISVGPRNIVTISLPKKKRKVISHNNIRQFLNNFVIKDPIVKLEATPLPVTPTQTSQPAPAAQIKQSTPLPEPVGQVVDFKVAKGDTDLRWLLIYDNAEGASMANQTRLIEELRRHNRGSIMASVIAVGSEIDTFDQINSFSSGLSSRVPELTNANHQMTMQKIIENNLIKKHKINAILWVTSDYKRSRERHFELVAQSDDPELRAQLSKIIVRRVFNVSSNGSCPISGAPSSFDTNMSWPQACISIDNIGNIFRNLPTKA